MAGCGGRLGWCGVRVAGCGAGRGLGVGHGHREGVLPPAEIRQLRDYTRLGTDLTRERTRHYSRLEKLLEDVLIKVSAVASKLDTLSVRDMAGALIAGDSGCPGLALGLARPVLDRDAAEHAGTPQAQHQRTGAV